MANILRGVGSIVNSKGEVFEWNVEGAQPGQGLIYQGGTWMPGDISGIGTEDNPYTSARQITNLGKPNGWYWVDLDGPKLLYINTQYSGGGWYLIIQNTGGRGGMPISWASATSTKQTFKTSSGLTDQSDQERDLSSFNLWTGMELWKLMTVGAGGQIAQVVYSSPTDLDGSYTKRATWKYTGFGSKYSLNGPGNVSSTSDNPGMYSYHAANGYHLTTYDQDNDASSSNCANNYGNSVWWYGGCWNGSAWGGGSYEDKYYWQGSGDDNHAYGATYVRECPYVDASGNTQTG